MRTKQMSRSKGFRASKPKVRTGCLTCKARRIKCDETRPACMRCARFGRRCGGYESDRPIEGRRPVALAPERPLVPRSVPPSPSAQLFENEQEFSYFRHYCDETVSSFAGAFELPVWNRVILQASHEQEFIRHAVIAIGGLSKSSHFESISNSPSSSSDVVFCTDRPKLDENFFLDQYNKFLRGSRKALTKGQEGQRMALIVCLLIICVEGLQGHHRSVHSHLNSGIDLLDEWLCSSRRRPSLPGITSPDPDKVEDEIVQQFRMLELESSVIHSPKPQEYHERLRRDGEETVNNMPKTFSSTAEARMFLELIMRRSHHFLGTVIRQKPKALQLFLSNPEAQVLIASFDTFKTMEGSIESLRFEQEKYAAENRRWNTAFETLFKTRIAEHHDFLSTRLLKIRSRVLGILLAGELSMSEMIYDKYLPDFTEIVELAKIFFSHPCSASLIAEGSYSSNAGLIFPLRLVATKSRSGALRREAISLLKSKSWRESSFWSTSSAQVSEWVMETEEEGVEGDWIPEWARLKLLESALDEGGGIRRTSVLAIRGTGEKKRCSWEWWTGKGCEVGTPRSIRSVGSDDTP